MYNLLYYNINKMDENLYKKELDTLSRIKKEEILKKADLKAQKRSLVGIMLAKQYLSKMYKIPENEIVFEKGEHGKPYVLNLPVHFNISHSGDYVVLAISDEPIGVDTEEIRDFSAIVAKKRFTEDELKYISGTGTSRKKSIMQRSFYEIWTGKEAYLKFKGTGLAGGLESITFKVQKGELIPSDDKIILKYDYSVPDCVTAIVTKRH